MYPTCIQTCTCSQLTIARGYKKLGCRLGCKILQAFVRLGYSISNICVSTGTKKVWKHKKCWNFALASSVPETLGLHNSDSTSHNFIKKHKKVKVHHMWLVQNPRNENIVQATDFLDLVVVTRLAVYKLVWSNSNVRIWACGTAEFVKHLLSGGFKVTRLHWSPHGQ